MPKINEVFVVNTRKSAAGNLTIHVGWTGKADGELGWFVSAPNLAVSQKDGSVKETPAEQVFLPGSRLTAGEQGFALGEVKASKYVDPTDGIEKTLNWVALEFVASELIVRAPARLVTAVTLG